MPGIRCCAFNCGNYFLKTKKNRQNIAYHRFPRDPSLREVWVLLCQPPSCRRIENCFVCSEHFSDSDYESELKDRMLGIQGRRRLKKDAVPKKKLDFLPKNDSDVKEFVVGLHIEDDLSGPSVKKNITLDDSDISTKTNGSKGKHRSAGFEDTHKTLENRGNKICVAGKEEPVASVGDEPLIKKIIMSRGLLAEHISPVGMSILLRTPSTECFNKKVSALRPGTKPFSASFSCSQIPGPSGAVNSRLALNPLDSEENKNIQESVGLVSDFVARIDSIIEKVEGLDPNKSIQPEEEEDMNLLPYRQSPVAKDKTSFNAEVVSRIDSILQKVSKFSKDSASGTTKRKTAFLSEFSQAKSYSDELIPLSKESGKSSVEWMAFEPDQDREKHKAIFAREGDKKEKSDPLYFPINDFIGGCFKKVHVEMEPETSLSCGLSDDSQDQVVCSMDDLSEGPPSPCSFIAQTSSPRQSNTSRQQELRHFISNELKIVQTVKLSKLLTDIYCEFKPTAGLQTLADQLVSNFHSK